jgi:SAM-dependent methyltransferase
MAISYDSIVPWGRALDEYVSMFALSASDLGKSILGCGDGPASFHCDLRRRGGRVVSVDPVYALSAPAIRRRIEETCEAVVDQTRRHMDRFVWGRIRDVEHLKAVRLAAMETFLDDFETGKREGRYVVAGVPDLPFANDTFDLCLSSHFLFLYSDKLSCDFHVQALGEMLRVAGEVRVFPLCDVNARRSTHVEPVIRHFRDKGLDVAEVAVDYEFQVGGNTMLRLRH